MKTKDFTFELPKELIAQHPTGERGQSRLMVLDRTAGTRAHSKVIDLPQILCQPPFLSPDGAKPLLVFNDSKVRKARLIGKSQSSGAQAEFLLLEKLQEEKAGGQPNVWKVMVKRAGRKKPGDRYVFFDDTAEETAGAEIAGAEITGIVSDADNAGLIEGEGALRFLQFDRDINDEWLDRYGHIPLPPYIKREDTPADAKRYQTVYAKNTGSAAAPTAGLHFTEEILARLAGNGIETVFITLHVGLGTFLPVRTENIKDHTMHEEHFIISEQSALQIEKAKTEKRKVIAVGTTCIRCLESAWTESGVLKKGEQDTSIFIYPSFRFKVADALFTNFHTPESTLLMLVAAFAGREFILESYQEAVREKYRFFSYGDAMLIG